MVRRVENLVVEHREIEGETKTDWVGRSKVSAGNFGGRLVSLKRFVGRDLTLVALGEFGEVTMVITLPIVFLVASTFGYQDSFKKL